MATLSSWCEGHFNVAFREAVESAHHWVDIPKPACQDIGDDFGAGDQIEMLEDHTDLTADEAHLILAGGGDILPIPNDLPSGGFDQPVDAAQQGGFPGAAQTDHGQKFTLFYGKADIFRACTSPSYVLERFLTSSMVKYAFL